MLILFCLTPKVNHTQARAGQKAFADPRERRWCQRKKETEGSECIIGLRGLNRALGSRTLEKMLR